MADDDDDEGMNDDGWIATKMKRETRQTQFRQQ